MRKNIFRVLTVVALLISLFLVGLLFFFYGNKDKGSKVVEDSRAKSVVMAPDLKKTDSSQILFPGYGDITIAHNDNSIKMLLYNPKENNVNFVFRIFLESKGEMKSLIHTGIVSPGKAINDIPVNIDLNPGEYKMSVFIDTSDLKDSNVKYTGTCVKTKLIVKN